MTNSNENHINYVERLEKLRSEIYASVTISQGIGLRQAEQEILKFFPITEGDGDKARESRLLIFRIAHLYYNFSQVAGTQITALQMVAEKGNVLSITKLFALGGFEPQDGSKSSDMSDTNAFLIEFIHKKCNNDSVAAFLMGVVSKAIIK